MAKPVIDVLATKEDRNEKSFELARSGNEFERHVAQGELYDLLFESWGDTIKELVERVAAREWVKDPNECIAIMRAAGHISSSDSILNLCYAAWANYLSETYVPEGGWKNSTHMTRPVWRPQLLGVKTSLRELGLE